MYGFSLTVEIYTLYILLNLPTLEIKASYPIALALLSVVSIAKDISIYMLSSYTITLLAILES